MGSNGSCAQDQCSTSCCGKEKSRPETSLNGYDHHKYPKSDGSMLTDLEEVTGMDPFATYANGVHLSEAATPPSPRATASEHKYLSADLAELRLLPDDGDRRSNHAHTFASGATYNGDWKGTARHGFGTQRWLDGARYLGQWSDNSADGQGIFKHADGDVYVGQWKLNKANGFGSYFHSANQSTYRGGWLDDLQHGYGVEEWEGGAHFRGQFVRGQKDGYGVYTWPDGAVYSGGFSNHDINGFGKYVGPDGREFSGMWKRAEIEGCGRYVWPDGRKYSGQFVQDLKDGFGIFIWQDGKRFDGWWKQGEQHGFGLTYSPHGEIIRRGMWNMGKAC